MIKSCISRCLRRYGRNLDTKATIVVLGCALGAFFSGDITGVLFMQCIAAGGIADATVDLSTCIGKCLRRHSDDD